MSCTVVEPGYVGLRIHLSGSERGLDKVPLETGRIWYNSFTQRLVVFPTFTQRIIWCKSADEGKTIDESLTFNSVEGASVNADVAISIRMVTERIPEIYARFRQEPGVILDGYVRDAVRNGFSATASRMQATAIYGEGKQKLLDGAKDMVSKQLESLGFTVDQLSFTNALRFDAKVEEAMLLLKSRYTIVLVTNNTKQAARVSDRVAFFLMGELVEIDVTGKIFTAPSDKRTEDYIVGKFG